MLTFVLLFVAVPATCEPLSLPPNVPTASQIDSYLERKKSNLIGHGGHFVTAAQQFDMDPRLVVAISGAESTFGKHLCARFNAWNWFHNRTCPMSPFDSYQQGIMTVTKFLRRSYINKGYDTIPLIQVKYCPTPDCGNWVSNVTRFRDEMPVGSSSASPVANPNPPGSQSQGTTRNSTRIFGIPIYLVCFATAAIVAWKSTQLLGRRL